MGQKTCPQIKKAIRKGELVLVYNKTLESQWGKLLKNRWNGPYRVIKQIKGGSYVLEELDGTKLARRVAASQIKKFYPRGVKITNEEKQIQDELPQDQELQDNNFSELEEESDTGSE